MTLFEQVFAIAFLSAAVVCGLWELAVRMRRRLTPLTVAGRAGEEAPSCAPPNIRVSPSVSLQLPEMRADSCT